MSKEKVFIVDDNNNPLEPQPRDIMIRDNLWCRVASIVVLDIQSKMVLCQKRSETKDQRPGLWVVEFGGKADPDEDCIITAQRELYEESGIQCDLSELKFSGIEKSTERHQFAYCYYIDCRQNIEIKPDPEEVSEIQWIPISEALEKLKTDPEWYSYGNDIKILRSFSS